MIINDLYNVASEKGHEVISIPLKESESFAIEDQNGCHIALSVSITGSNKKEKLAHELGHCEYGGFYNYHSPFEMRSRSEVRADRWAFLKLIPFTELQALTEQELSLWEIADYFGVSTDFAHSAIKFYTEVLGRRL